MARAKRASEVVWLVARAVLVELEHSAKRSRRQEAERRRQTAAELHPTAHCLLAAGRSVTVN